MSGHRKTSKEKALKNLRDRFKLAYTDTEIEEMSTGQLRKTIYDIRVQHGLTIHPQSKIPGKRKEVRYI